MVYLARRTAPNTAAPTDPGYDPNEQKRTQVVFGDWTPKNLGPHEENVEVYSNCEEVELFLNGKSLGSKPKPTDDTPRNWHIAFEPGTIKAVAKNGGKKVAEYELRTAGSPAKILLSTDKRTLADSWEDVVYVTATVVDGNDVPIPDADNLVSFTVKGPGAIAAADSADNTDHDSFQTTKRKVFQGRCIAYVKARSGSGPITVTAESTGLKSAAMQILLVENRLVP